MRHRFIFKQDEVLERVSKGRAETRLLARADRVEVLKQFVPQENTFYLDSVQEWEGFEFIYLMEGRLAYLGSEPPTLLEPGDYIARERIEEQSWFRAEADSILLYMSSQPAFHIMREEAQDFIKLAERIEQDEYTDGHCRRLEQMARLVGERLGLSGLQLYNLSYAAFFHDLGKAKVPREILRKPTKLTEQEWEVVKQHTTWGREMLESKNFLKEVARIVGETHERVDGQGYPQRLMGDQISLEAKIISVADTYDAMTTDRPYRKALTNEEAIRELQKHAEVQFDEHVVAAFIEVLRERDPCPGARRAWFDQEWGRRQRRDALLKIAEGILMGKDIQKTLQEVVTAITQYTPFQRAALALYDKAIAPQSSEGAQIVRVACSGMTPQEEAQLRAHPLPIEERRKIFKDEFRISRSYYVPHDRLPWGEHPGLIKSQAQPSAEQGWHPDDSLCIPMWVGDQILGTITLDDPMDGRVPAVPVLEPIEIFAALTAIAIREAEQKRQLQEASYRDPLTHAKNRRYLDELIHKEQTRASRHSSLISFIMVDFEDFHSVNDRCGHLAGDRVLQETTLLFQRNLRSVDTVIRYGGDEFLIIMPQTSEREALEASKRLRDCVKNRDFGIPCRVSIRTGVSTWNPGIANSCERVLAKADHWMYRRQPPRNGQRRRNVTT